MEQSIFIQLSLILAVAAGISVTFRYLRQPLIIGYILIGFLVGPALFGLIHEEAAFQIVQSDRHRAAAVRHRTGA